MTPVLNVLRAPTLNFMKNAYVCPNTEQHTFLHLASDYAIALLGCSVAQEGRCMLHTVRW